MNLTQSKINNYYNILKLEQYLGLKKNYRDIFLRLIKTKIF